MTDESATDDFNLDAALESAYTTMTEPEKVEEPQDTEVKTEEEDTDQGSVTESKPAEQPLTAPERWSAERKATFAALPREAQQLLLEREGEVDKAFTQKTQELAEQRKQFEALEQVLAPRRQVLASQYGSEAAALNQLFQLSDFADRDPAGFIQWFAQQRGISLQNSQAEDAYVDPAVQTLQQKLQNIEQTITQKEQRELQRQQETVKTEINVFRDQKDTSGNPLHPHFEDVRAEMAALMQSGAARTLEDAYKKATWANDSVREKILAEQRKQEDADRINQMKQSAAKAEKATGKVVKSSNTGSTPAKNSNWEDTLSEKASELYGT